jgi:hypothetical protein
MEQLFQEEISSMNKFRYSLIKKINEAEENIVGHRPNTDAISKKVDELGDEIYTYIKSYHESLPVDFVMEQLANLGHCICLLYDDNGHWVFSSAGFQNVPMSDEPEDIDTQFFVKAKEWKNTIREALNDYLNEDNDE